MPTTRARHIITETDEIAAALDRAAARWPQDAHTRKQLLLRLITEGAEGLGDGDITRAERRRRAIEQMRGRYPGLGGTQRLRQLRDEWPD